MSTISVTHIMTPTLLSRCGEALYGPRWQSELARDLRVDDRSLRRWLSGDRALPDGIRADLLRLLEERVVNIEELIPELLVGPS